MVSWDTESGGVLLFPSSKTGSPALWWAESFLLSSLPDPGVAPLEPRLLGSCWRDHRSCRAAGPVTEAPALLHRHGRGRG